MQFDDVHPCNMGLFPKLTGAVGFRVVNEQHEVTDEPLQYQSIRKWLNILGRAAAFESRLLSYVFRRGIAYLLATHCTKEERSAPMGHMDGDGVYWRSYRNQTSTVDFQAIAHRADAEDVSCLSSVALNRREDAPTALSVEGYRTVYNDTQVLAANKREIELLITVNWCTATP